ncbi:hypothetical protein HL657_08570 [Methanoculleus sp. YWC-01]|jgi:hypothetical protein|uniref:Uncharacterized protein n=1 Tax=Methanoculleus nereidis TaxID=2735141 RepID=A0ABU3Z337_9EURY|nr:hypothetical protein [Methanoculleus sp. YWC-01]MCK9298993.1 hypothetical protein [Methanoculleus sp.]MDV4343217.1 hypothetical protein [Methanoculleus sp. YWC-01]PKL54985.1 MAG: hypothetical protein CVV35_12405 [Methanomicrobiales archaeon HGW-Methanomicrobiales-6]
MQSDVGESGPSRSIYVTEDVRSYVLQRKRDFRVSTSCSGPILLPTSVKPPKVTDLRIPVGDYTIYISKYQARYIEAIHRRMIPIFYEDF